MPSPQLTLAAQTNGKLSRGPVTPEGKRKSSANSRKHGLRSKTIQTDDACEAYAQWLLPSLLAQYHPANPTELDLVETLAQSAARQDWALRLFDQHLAQAIEHQSNPQAPYKHPGRNAMPLLHRAFCRFDREERRARQQLLKLQSQPLPETPKMHERTLSSPPASPVAQIEKMHERTEFPHRSHEHRPPLIYPHPLKSENRIPFAPSPACGNRKPNQ